MPATPDDLFARLEELGIRTTTTEHPPLFTVEESKALRGDLPGGHCKSLFLKDKKGALWLVVALEDRAVDLERYPTEWNQFDGGKSVCRAGAARSAMRRIGQASQRTRGADLPHLRPGAFAPWRRCGPLPMPDIAMRPAPGHDAKSSRSNGSSRSGSALMRLRRRLGAKTLSFANADLLMAILGVTPGAVTPFGLINDSEGRVQVVLEKAMLAEDPLNYHPLHNGATTALAPGDLIRFIEATGHRATILDFDAELADEGEGTPRGE